MATSTTKVSATDTLHTLKEADQTIADPNYDIRGRDVIAKDGEKIGKVDALLVDENEGKVRFMRVEAGGFLGIGAKKWLVPIDAITRVDSDHVYVDQTKQRFTSAPVYDPTVVSKNDNDYWGGLYNYWGYGPYWAPGYRYPTWW